MAHHIVIHISRRPLRRTLRWAAATVGEARLPAHLRPTHSPILHRNAGSLCGLCGDASGALPPWSPATAAPRSSCLAANSGSTHNWTGGARWAAAILQHPRRWRRSLCCRMGSTPPTPFRLNFPAGRRSRRQQRGREGSQCAGRADARVGGGGRRRGAPGAPALPRDAPWLQVVCVPPSP